jgi:hypothetical protein
MKKVTAAERLLEALGMQGKFDTSKYEEDPKKRQKLQKKNKSGLQGITEEEIQTFREAQGVIYFLQAPELFKQNQCKHCEEFFLVSRRDVAYCSYTCIKLSLAELGIEWSRDGKFEELAKDPSVYDGNEPIWIRNLDRIKKVLNLDQELVPQ